MASDPHWKEAWLKAVAHAPKFAALAAPVFKHNNWEWTPIGVPDASAIECEFIELLHLLYKNLSDMNKPDYARVNTGRLQVSAVKWHRWEVELSITPEYCRFSR